MQVKQEVGDLIALAAPLWAGEAEIVRTYWTAPMRSAKTDMLWLARQCFKEFWGSGVGKFDRGGVFLGTLKNLVNNTPNIDVSLDRHEILDTLEGLRAEFAHYCAFADLYDAIRPKGTARIHPAILESWPEEDSLTALRYRHQDTYGAIGMRACKFTEGGYCTLFSEGKALKGKGGISDMIADACAKVFDDEFDHMLAGIGGIADEQLSGADWQLLGQLVEEQLQHRIRMRNAQFSFPLSEQRVQAIFRKEIEPLAFDYERARLAA